MLKKSIPVIFILAGVCMLFFVAHALTKPVPQSQLSLDQLKQQAIDSIRQGNANDANSAVKAIFVNYIGDARLSSTLLSIAEAYKNSSKFSKSAELNKFIVDNMPESKEAAKAQGSFGVCLAALGDKTGAKEAIKMLKTNYASEPNLSELIFKISDGLYWISKLNYADCNEGYLYVLNTFPKTDDWSMFAAMGLGISCAASHDFNSCQLYINNLLTDYAENPKLPEALFMWRDA